MFQLMACVHTESNSTIRPQHRFTSKTYTQEDFIKLDKTLFLNNDHTNSTSIAVRLYKGKLILGEQIYVYESSFELEDGKLEIIDHGEFGGALNFISNDISQDTVAIFNRHVDFFFRFQKRLFFISTFSPSTDKGGQVFELKRVKGAFTYSEVTRLKSNPRAMTIYKDKILIASRNGSIVVLSPKNSGLFNDINSEFDKEILTRQFLLDSDANSIAVKNEDEVYLGITNGYLEFSLNSTEIESYAYRKSLIEGQQKQLELRGLEKE